MLAERLLSRIVIHSAEGCCWPRVDRIDISELNIPFSNGNQPLVGKWRARRGYV
jgi:hypothetical protein